MNMMNSRGEVVETRRAQWLAENDYKEEGSFYNPYLRHSDCWRAYHAVESRQLLKEISGEE